MTMWQLILFIVIFPVFSFAGNYNYSIRYIDVPVDHFSFTTNATFKLRYLYNETYWTNNGPIFFYTGNEGDVETFAQNTGFMWEIAPEFGALLVFAEHRYYGKSLPFGNESFSDVKHLGYLTSAQAMADYIFLISHLQNTSERRVKLEHPVIAFGGSYGGMLAAWIRLKYPATILGSIASSAPILQFGDLVPCNSYNKICTEVYRLFSKKGTDCSALIKRSWRSLRKIATTDAGKTWLSNELKLCKPLKTDDDTQSLIDWLTEIYGNVAMVNYPYPTNFLAPLPGHPIRVMCNHLTNMTLQEKDLIRAIFDAISVYTNYTGKTRCNDVLQATPGLDAHMWDFQACSEMVMPMCSTAAEMFEVQSWNLTAYSETCYKKWGVRPNANLVIDEYGGARVSSYTNVVFSNGLLDPWSAGGVTNINNMYRGRRLRRSTSSFGKLCRGCKKRHSLGFPTLWGWNNSDESGVGRRDLIYLKKNTQIYKKNVDEVQKRILTRRKEILWRAGEVGDSVNRRGLLSGRGSRSYFVHILFEVFNHIIETDLFKVGENVIGDHMTYSRNNVIGDGDRAPFDEVALSDGTIHTTGDSVSTTGTHNRVVINGSVAADGLVNGLSGDIESVSNSRLNSSIGVKVRKIENFIVNGSRPIHIRNVNVTSFFTPSVLGDQFRTIRDDNYMRRRRTRDARDIRSFDVQPYVVILIPGAPHHIDLRAAQSTDPIAVQNARNVHKSEIRKWLNSYYNEE